MADCRDGNVPRGESLLDRTAWPASQRRHAPALDNRSASSRPDGSHDGSPTSRDAVSSPTLMARSLVSRRHLDTHQLALLVDASSIGICMSCATRCRIRPYHIKRPAPRAAPLGAGLLAAQAPASAGAARQNLAGCRTDRTRAGPAGATIAPAGGIYTSATRRCDRLD